MKQSFRLAVSALASFVMLFSILVINPSSALAAVGGIPASQPTSSSAISIVPRKNAIINPGQTVKDTLVIGNQDNAAPLYLTLRVVDFTYLGNEGTAKFYLGPKDPQTTWSLKPYINLPQNVTIAAGATKTINYSISIPKDLGAGSYYSAILYESGLGDTGNVGLSATGATLVFVSVPGKVHEKLTLDKFGQYSSSDNGNDGKFLSYITTTKPNMLAFSLKNSGNVVESPAGSIVIKKWGHKYKTIANVNPNSDLTLLGQTRLYSDCIIYQSPGVNNINAGTCVKNPSLAPGHYTATLSLYYGQNGNPTQEITETISFWYIPVWLLILMIIVLLILIYLGWRLYIKIRGWIDPNYKQKHSKGQNFSYRLRSKRAKGTRIRQ